MFVYNGRMELTVDLDSEIPVYRQIVNAVRRGLVSGEVAPGDTLPTVRQLAFDLGIHHNTVAKAYRELAEEGWLNLQRRNGALVLDRARPDTTRTLEHDYVRRFRELIAQAIADGVSYKVLLRELNRAEPGAKR